MSIAAVVFNSRDSSGTTVAATRTFAAGAFGLVVGMHDNTGTGITFSGSGLTYNPIAAASVTNGGDAFRQEAAWFQFVAGGSLTVTATSGSAAGWAGIMLVEFAGVSGFDKASYLRTTASPNCGSSTNANATATRIAVGAAWNGGTLAAGGGFTDQGSGAPFGGTPLLRGQSVQDVSAAARTMAFGAGTGVSPFHCSQFIFSDTGGGAPARRTRLRRGM